MEYPIEYPIFPFRHTWESQPMNGAVSHLGVLAIDCGVLIQYKDTKLYAPFTGKIVYKDNYAKGALVALESVNKVRYANGITDYMTLLIGHDSDTSNLSIGQIVKQGDYYLDMGNAGNVDTHSHLEVQKGKFKMATSFTSQGGYKFENTIEPFNALFLTKDTIYKYSKYTWKILPDTPPITPVVDRNESVAQIKVLADELRVRADHSTNSPSLGFVVKNGIYNDLEVYNDGTYTWHRIANGQWIADNGTWLELYPVLDYKKLYEEELQKTEELRKQNQVLATENVKYKDIIKQVDKLVSI